jgi:hypothetical protein
MQLRRYAFASAIIVSSSCGAGDATEVNSSPEGEPAQLVTLSGPAAEALRGLFDPVVPVLVAGAGSGVVAIVFDQDPLEAERLRDELFFDDPVEGCSRDGAIACCNKKTGEMVLSVTFGGRGGWVRLGELCEAPVAEEAGGVEFLPVPEELSRALSASHGVDYCFMDLPDAGGTPRVLVNAPSPDSPLWTYCFMQLADANGTPEFRAGAPLQGGELWLASSIVRRSVAQADSPIILAKHPYAPPPPRCRLSNPPHCNSEGIKYKRCHPDLHHWYKKDRTVSYIRWCQSKTECDC